MSKHTPGPWCVKPYKWQRGNVSVFAPKYGRAPHGACVAYTPCSAGVGGADGALANARLIAAAPTQHAEMLRYLPVLERAEADSELWARLTDGLGIATLNGYRAAIAKAEEA